MSNYWLLFKFLFSNGYKNRIKNVNGPMRAVQIILLIVFSGLLIGFNIFLAYIASYVKEIGAIADLLIIMMLLTAFLTLTLGIIAMIGMLFLGTDTEFLLGLPFKSNTIFFAKLSYIYVLELITTAVLLLPAFLVIGIAASMSAWFYLAALISIIATPILPLLIASILSLPLMYVVSFFKSRAVMTSIAFIVIFGIAIGVYFNFIFRVPSYDNNNAGGSISIQEQLRAFFEPLRAAKYILPPVTAIAYLASGRLDTLFGNFDSEAVTVLINIGVFAIGLLVLFFICYALAGVVYKQGLVSQLENKKTKGKIGADVDNKVMTALLKKEWKELIRTPIFAFQCLSGVIFTPVLLFFLSDRFGSVTSDIADNNVVVLVLSSMMPIMSFMFIGMPLNQYATTLLSREGEKFYFLKILPIPYETQVAAKLRLGFIVSIITIAVSMGVCAFVTKDWIMTVVSAGFLLLYSKGSQNMSANFDLDRPYLKWNTPTELMRHNKQVRLPVLITFALGIAGIVMTVIMTVVLNLSGISEVAIKAIILSQLYILATAMIVVTHINMKNKIHRCIDRVEI